ncbi:MAG TPA: hypothetical protein P5040_03640 [Smithella sp.]|nr:hypothetical protein [Smithella sp.]HRS97252.1 hypothetical protein [Smithella sp.]
MFSEKEKIGALVDEILQGPELLRINPRPDSSEGLLKLFLVFGGLLLVFFYKDAVGLLREKPLNQQLVLIGMTVLFAGVAIFAIFKSRQIQSKVLIITEKGAFMGPLFAQRWQDISEYQWNTVGGKGNPFLEKQSNPSLFLYNNKGSWPKTYDLAKYGIFFTTDQVQYLESLFNRLGIKKREE